MTTTQLSYCLVRYQPNPSRHEVVNIGVVLFTADGPVLEVGPNLTKLLAIDPNLSLSQVHADAVALGKTLTALWEQGVSAADSVQFLGKALSGASCMPLGMVAATTPHDTLADLLHQLVDVPATSKPAGRTAKGLLHKELRDMFKHALILGKTPGDISQHMVVPNFPIDAEVGLFAEFALRNGKLRVTETVDFRSTDGAGKKREAESKTLVLLQALETVGKADLHRYVVVSGATDKTQASLNLLSRHADDLIVRESAQDWLRYIREMAEAAKAPILMQHH
jgi:hypothetical protein